MIYQRVLVFNKFYFILFLSDCYAVSRYFSSPCLSMLFNGSDFSSLSDYWLNLKNKNAIMIIKQEEVYNTVHIKATS